MDEGREIHKPQSHPHRLELLLSTDTGHRMLGSGDGGLGAINEVSRHACCGGTGMGMLEPAFWCLWLSLYDSFFSGALCFLKGFQGLCGDE
jgi:hypothetical protein